MKHYYVPLVPYRLDSLEDWDAKPEIPALQINQFRPESSDHRPQTLLRLAHDNSTIFGKFEVDDCYVRCVNSAFQSPTHRDSCVELFLQPTPGAGYFNFEWNCCGALAVFYITDSTRTDDGFKAYSPLRADEAAGFSCQASLSGVINPEITRPIHWALAFSIKLSVLQNYVDFHPPISGQVWHANAFKCADESSHPHWAAWSPVPILNFHLPAQFGSFQFL